MQYDFDKIINRKNTNSLKHDFNQRRFGREDILPMWVADMDFETPHFIIEAIRKRLNHPVYGYTLYPESLYESIISWIYNRHQWKVKKEEMIFCTGVVPALHYCVKALTNPGDKIIVQPPVYYPFFSVIKDNDRVVQENPLKIIDGKFEIDFEHLEKRTDEKTKMLFLCSPHNPGGRVWSKKNLLNLATFCLKHNIIIISDEIHADMVYNPNKHTPLASLDQEISNLTITLMSPSKTFNLAGLAVSYIISENKKYKARLNEYLDRTNINAVNIFSQAAMEAAYKYGNKWLDQLMDYLNNNFLYLNAFLKDRLPELNVMESEATYLAWIDFNNSRLKNNDIKHFMIHEAGLGLNDGPVFGTGGDGYQRMNFACPKEILHQGLTKLYNSMEKLV